MLKITKEDLHRLYVEENLTREAIAKLYHCDVGAIRRWIRKYEIPTQRRPEAKRNYTGFFTRWSPEMAWVLGLLFTDACIHQYNTNKYNCVLSSIDIDMLTSVKTIMGVTNVIYHVHNRVHSLNIARTLDCMDLIALGCTPRKSRTMLFPEIPNQYLSHFVRGVWDGNGTIMIDRSRRYPQQRTGLVSGSDLFITALRDAIFDTVKIFADVKTRQEQYQPYYAINFYTRKAVKLFNWIYADSTPETRLHRKYLRAEPFLD